MGLSTTYVFLVSTKLIGFDALWSIVLPVTEGVWYVKKILGLTTVRTIDDRGGTEAGLVTFISVGGAVFSTLIYFDYVWIVWGEENRGMVESGFF